jgi:hypothetical protein
MGVQNCGGHETLQKQIKSHFIVGNCTCYWILLHSFDEAVLLTF